MTNKNKSVKTINKKEKVDIFKLIREKKEEKKKLLQQTGGSGDLGADVSYVIILRY